MQKSVAFLHPNNELSERESNQKNPFKIVSKGIKYIRKNLTMEAEDLRSEIYRSLMKKTEDNTMNWKDILCS